MNYTIALIIILSSITLLCGCTTFSGSKMNWPEPEKPNTKSVQFNQITNGYFLSSNNASNLNYNLIEQKAYTEKLEILVKTMKKHYKAN